jgi:predicted Zn-dependent peptidase
LNKYQLSNGMYVVTEKIPSTRSVSFGIWVKAGSRSETLLRNGITHFIEHMLFKGTSRYTARDIADVFDGLGGNINAFTSKENTCYYFIVLDKHLPQALAVLADMFFYSLFAPEELEKEKNVIYEEIAMYEDTPDDQVHDLVATAAFGTHSLGYPILGTNERLASFQSADLRNYMEQHYTIDNIVISVAGNIDESLPELLEEHFAFYENHSNASPLVQPQFMSDALFHQKATEQQHICLGLPGLPLGHEQMYALNVFNNVLGGGMSSRLFQEVREQRGLAYAVYSYHIGYVDSGLFAIYAGTSPKQATQLLEVVMNVLGDLKAKGITDAELRRTQEQLKGNFILSLESSSSRMHRMGRSQLMLGKHDSQEDVLEKIDAVTLADVQQLIERLVAEPFAVAMIGTEEEALQTFRRDQLVTSD